MGAARKAWRLVREAVRQFHRDEAFLLGAAIAYYAALSIPPLAVLLLWLTGALGAGAQDAFLEQVHRVLGESAGVAVGEVLESTGERPGLASLAGVVALGTLVFSATGVFAQLQNALDIVWNVKPAPGRGLLGWLRKRVLSLGMIVTIGFLLMLSFAVDTALAALATAAGDRVPGGAWLWSAVNLVLALVVFVLLVAAMYKILPDVRITWRDVWTGAGVTGVLLVAGKHAIGIYLGRTSVGSAYGAAGSLLVLLVWVYFASLIVFFGAELTEVWSRLHGGRRIVPDRHAEWRTGSPLGARERPAADAGRP